MFWAGGSWAVGVVVEDPDLTQLRVVLTAARRRAGWTYEQLAARSGVSRQTLINVASGRHRGTLKTWLKLARAFGVSLDELLAPVWPRPDQ